MRKKCSIPLQLTPLHFTQESTAAYDAAGNMLTDSRNGALGMSFVYDVEGRLSKAYKTNNPAEGGTYAYDSRGRLSSRTITQAAAPTSTTILYVYDLNDHIIAEMNASGQTLREYLWLGDTPVAVVDKVNTAPVLYYVHTDHLGRPARITNAAQAWVWDVIYAPFGATSAIFTNPATNDMRFPGQWFQMESGLAYNWHRHYDASLGRYVQPDPLGLRALLSDGPSVYGYVGANPLAWVDPEGFQTGPYAPPPLKIPGGPNWKWAPDAGNRRGGSYIGDGYTASWDPEGHWDCNRIGVPNSRQRYDWRGNPISADQAHKPPPFTPRLPAWFPIMPPILFNPSIICIMSPELCDMEGQT